MFFDSLFFFAVSPLFFSIAFFRYSGLHYRRLLLLPFILHVSCSPPYFLSDIVALSQNIIRAMGKYKESTGGHPAWVNIDFAVALPLN